MFLPIFKICTKFVNFLLLLWHDGFTIQVHGTLPLINESWSGKWDLSITINIDIRYGGEWLFLIQNTWSCNQLGCEWDLHIITLLVCSWMAARFSAICTVYKQWLATSGLNCGLEIAVKHKILFHISAITLTAYK